MKPFFAPFALVFALLVATSALAEKADVPITMQVAGRNVVVTPPEAACSYDRANPVDAQILYYLEKGLKDYNQLVLAFADCKDLDATRTGKQQTTGDYGQIMFPLSDKDMLDLTRTELVSKLTDIYRTNTGAFDEGLQKGTEILKSITSDTLKINNSRVLGVIRSDPDLVQIGMMQSIQTPEKAVLVLGVITATKLGVPVTINLYHPSSGADNDKALHELSIRSAAYARRLIALNPDTALPHADERREDSKHILGLVLGALLIVGAVIGLCYKKRKAP